MGAHEVAQLVFSSREIIDAAQRVTGRVIPVRMMPRRPGDPARLVADSGAAGFRLAASICCSGNYNHPCLAVGVSDGGWGDTIGHRVG